MNVPHPSPNSVVTVTNEDPVLNAKAVKFVCFLFQHCLESQRGKENWGGGAFHSAHLTAWEKWTQRTRGKEGRRDA